jgi:hypothetical protein
VAFDGSAWGTPVPVFQQPFATPPSISCVSSSLCVAVNGLSYAVFDGTNWSGPIDGFIQVSASQAISCISPTFCMVAAYGVYELNASARTSTHLAFSPGLTEISCATETFCVGLDGDSTLYEYQGTNWPIVPDAEKAGISAVSCPTRNSCVVSYGGSYSILRAGSLIRGLSGGGGVYPRVSCTSATFCGEVSEGESSFLLDSTWSASTFHSGSATAISCVNPEFCMAVELNGQASRYSP